MPEPPGPLPASSRTADVPHPCPSLEGEGQQRVTIHVYALCWNEARMLPHFFSHYDGIVDRYFVFDNGSTDRSLEILASHPAVTLGHFRFTGDSLVQAAIDQHNGNWKSSRGAADWVIVCDVDEHLYHEDLRGYLARCREAGVTVIVPDGYVMISEEFPLDPEPLHRLVRRGMRMTSDDKPIVFDPGRIDDIGFAPGRHLACPVGDVVVPATREVKLLHYRFLGLEYVVARYAELATGLRARDIAMGWGHQYLWDRARIVQRFEEVRDHSELVV
jgi:glycosyltransferase involved in cell wall biosynthesis